MTHQFPELVQLLPDIVYMSDASGNFIMFNKAMTEKLGYELDDLVGKKFTTIIHEDDLERVEEFYAEMFKNRDPESNFELRILKKNGGYCWVNQNVVTIFEEDGKTISKYIGTVRNIDNQKEAERKLVVSEKKYRELFDHSTDLIHSIDTEGNFIYVNKKWCETLGYRESEIQQMNLFELLAPETAEHCQSIFEEIMNTGDAPEGRPSYFVITKNGERVLVEGSVTLKKDGDKVLSIQSFLRDITEQNMLATEVKKQEQNLRAITETLTDVYYLYNVLEKRYEYISPNCERVMGGDQEFFYSGQSHTVVFGHPEDQKKLQQAKTIVESGGEYEIEYRVIINGEIRWINERSIPIKDDLNQVIMNSGVCRDVTRAKEDQELIKRQNKEISHSIDYAKIIQTSALPTNEEIKNIFPESFVLYIPKDKLSGDFYVAEVIRSNELQEFNAMVVADCTGHGIPGGILSMLCTALVKETFTRRECNNPSEAFDFIRDKLIQLFRSDENKSFYDGMDAVFCVLDPRTLKLQFAGANNPVIVVRDGELIEHKGDPSHVGYGMSNEKFSLNEIQLQKGDQIYLFSDGYADQFGGPEFRRYKRKYFYNLILELSKFPIEKQEEHFRDEFLEWQGENEQTDDVTLVGIKI